MLSFFKKKKNTDSDTSQLDGVVHSCSVCENASEIKDESNILCLKFGIVNKEHSCKKFHYDPLKRVPHKRLYGISDIHELVEDCVLAEGRTLNDETVPDSSDSKNETEKVKINT